jgi:hypothetical protein
MVSDGDRSVMFELDRFAWGAPDRLELSGTFVGLRDVPRDDPVLVLRGAERTHRLAVLPDSLDGSPEDGQRWRAAFAWKEAPTAFEVAELEFGGDISIELPEPRARRWRRQVLEVRQARAERDGRSARGPREDVISGAAAESVRLQAELLAAQAEVREVHAVMQQTEAELTRAREDLEAERARHAADAGRFREGLESVRGSAEEALAVEQSAAQQLDLDLREAQDVIEAKDAGLEHLRDELDAAAAARSQAESDAAAEIAALRERVAELQRAGEEVDRLRSELEQTRKESADARAELTTAQSAAEEARGEAERLHGRLTTIRNALDDGE